ncbi:MAG TPA: biotin--[acetyl-CoA-carboxylase] ligase [Aeromicrobium sp.]|nr:biotin--[acetyl-CoA-carboxylase] ligase [Aeromicrobium sp.]
MEWDVQTVAETASTNADVAGAARSGAAEGLVIVADHQTAGRGRLNRSWESPAGSGLAASFLLRPLGLAPERWPWIPLMAGLAVADAVLGVGLDPRLKWPNDVEVDGRKLAGLLVERVETPSGAAAVVGIGLNIAMTAEQLPIPTATSLRLQGVDVGRDTVLARLLDALGARYEQLADEPGALRDDYVAACGTTDSPVRVTLPDGSELAGRATDVDELGRLVVDGRPITAGDVVHVRA